MSKLARSACLFIGAVLLVSACDRALEVAAPPIATSVTAPAALIAVSPHFYFMPPIARGPRNAGEFDAALAPVVEICVWQANACAMPLVSRLTNVKVRGSSDEDGAEADDDEDGDNESEGKPFYAVRWRTRGLNLDPAKTYRLRVLVAGTELGSADVDVVRNARERKGVDKSRFVPLLAGKNLRIRFRIEKGAVTVLGVAGGHISALGGRVQLDIPAGALARDVGFTFKQTSGPSQPGGFVVPGGTIEFGPDGLRFRKPVQLTLRYDDAGLPASVESRLRLQKLIGGRWVLVPGSTVNVSANTVTGLISGFSTYGIVTWDGAVPILQGFGTAVVDGVLDAGEWDPSASVDFFVNLPAGGGTANGTLYVMNNRTNLYLAVRIDGLALNHNQWLQFAFNNDNDGGPEENGDDVLLHSTVAPNTVLDRWVEIVPPCQPGTACVHSQMDNQSGGTQDGAASFIKAGGISVVELVHPLNSLDDLHDFSLSIGDTVGFWALLQILDQQVNIGTTNFPDGAPWGKIVIADSAPPPPPPPTIPADTGTVSAGMNFTCAVAMSDTVYCWGANDYGALGNKSTVPSRVPVMIWSLFTYASVSAGSAAAPRTNGHACAVTTHGEAHCWGGNTFGQLGNGGTLPIDTATPVITTERFKSISAGQEFTCAVTINGTGLCWGFGGSGQLGDGAQTGSILPVAVSGNLTFERISAGAQHACGVTTNGDVYCWGANNEAQLGLGTQSSPHLVPQLVTSGFRSVSAGVDHTCGLNETGTVYCWGANQFGQIGNGTLTRRLSPVAIGGGYKSVDVGGSSGGVSPIESHTCAVKVLGAAYCWGGNSSGQVGDGFPVPIFPIWLPVAVVGGHQFRNVSAGASHSCGVTLGGDTYCWGSSGSGELGVPGLFVPRATPVLVSGGLIFH